MYRWPRSMPASASSGLTSGPMFLTVAKAEPLMRCWSATPRCSFTSTHSPSQSPVRSRRLVVVFTNASRAMQHLHSFNRRALDEDATAFQHHVLPRPCECTHAEYERERPLLHQIRIGVAQLAVHHVPLVVRHQAPSIQSRGHRIASPKLAADALGLHARLLGGECADSRQLGAKGHRCPGATLDAQLTPRAAVVVSHEVG